MNEEFSEPINDTDEMQNESIDIYERQTYLVKISGENVMIPVERFVELPIYLAESFMEASREDTKTAGQQVLSEELTAYLNQQFPGIADGDFTLNDIIIRPVLDNNES